MVWPMLAVVAASNVVGGLLQERQNAKAHKAQQAAAYKTYLNNYQMAEQHALSVQGQISSLRQQAAKSQELAQRSAQSSHGSLEAAVAAAGVKGATVDALHNDIQRDMQERQYELTSQYVYEELGLLDQRWRAYADVYAQGAGSATQKYRGAGLGQHLLQGGLAAASLYAQQHFQFGSAKPNAATGGK